MRGLMGWGMTYGMSTPTSIDRRLPRICDKMPMHGGIVIAMQTALYARSGVGFDSQIQQHFI
jgi:hypothetical protein